MLSWHSPHVHYFGNGFASPIHPAENHFATGLTQAKQARCYSAEQELQGSGQAATLPPPSQRTQGEWKMITFKKETGGQPSDQKTDQCERKWRTIKISIMVPGYDNDTHPSTCIKMRNPSRQLETRWNGGLISKEICSAQAKTRARNVGNLQKRGLT